jgi:hypothetical protein
LRLLRSSGLCRNAVFYKDTVFRNNIVLPSSWLRSDCGYCELRDCDIMQSSTQITVFRKYIVPLSSLLMCDCGYCDLLCCGIMQSSTRITVFRTNIVLPSSGVRYDGATSVFVQCVRSQFFKLRPFSSSSELCGTAFNILLAF